jgi:hypothetical protein
MVEEALATYTKPGDAVFDPFCGSGTTLVASLVHRRRSTGTDIDTLAGMLSEVKCTPVAPSRYARWRKHFVARLTKAFREIGHVWRPPTALQPGTLVAVGSLHVHIPQFPELHYWFSPQLVVALATIAEVARQCHDPHYERVALLSLSAAIIAKWPNTLSFAMDVDHTRPHRREQQFTLEQVLHHYVARLDRSLACLGALHERYRHAGVLHALSERARVVYPHDAREPVPTLPDESQHLVLTSPPYFNAVDYPRAHRLSVCWMHSYAPADLASRRRYIGLHHATAFLLDPWLHTHPQIHPFLPPPLLRHPALVKKLCAFFADLEHVLHQVWRVLAPGGHAVFLLATNVIKGARVESHAVLAALAQALGFLVLETTPRVIASRRRRFPVGPCGFDGPMTHEYRIVFRKPRA